jgi:uncharacterized RDD family membrane protein YckC
MSQAGALYRCVCGHDIPVKGKEPVACPTCGRLHHRPEGVELGAAETIVVSKSGRSGSGRSAAVGTRPGAESVALEAPADARPNLVGRGIDHFEVLEELGRGGMGTVYRALDRSLERYVALKVLDSAVALSQQDIVEAFTHEARTQARVSHPGIATIYYVGKFEGMTYFAMEIVPGRDLESWLDEGPLPFRQVVNAAVQVVQALKEAQARGVIHRDVKPGNIILSDSGRVKVTDFGLSKTEKGGLQITGARNITGTPYYIAPEQARGESTDFRTDIYSLGATVYHLAYGRPPFDGDNFMAVIAKHLGDPVRFPTSPPQDVPKALPIVIGRMMAKRPEERYASYEELEKALQELRPEAQTPSTVRRRITAALLDTMMLFIVASIFTMVVGLGATLLGRSIDQRSTAVQGVAWGVAAVLAIAGQANRGATAGKLFGRMRIARVDGFPVERWRLALRGICQFLVPLAGGAVSAAALLGLAPSANTVAAILLGTLAVSIVDFLWTLRSRDCRTFHDLALKTWVIDRT